jgi:intracellular multiplication protein IcmE
MADENDQLDPFLEGDDELLAATRGNDDEGSQKQNLKQILEQNPSLKFFGLVAGGAVLLISFMVFGGDSKGPSDEEVSAIGGSSTVSQAPGTAALPPAYEEAVRQANKSNADLQAAIGGSSIPTPIAKPTERIEAPVQEETGSDPLSEWRRQAEARKAEREQTEEMRRAAGAVPSLPVTPRQRAGNMPSLPTGSGYGRTTGIGGGEQVPAQQYQQAGQYLPPQQQQQPQHPPLPLVASNEQITQISQGLMQQLQTVLEAQTLKDSPVIRMNIEPGYNMQKHFPPEPTPAAIAAARTTAAQQAAASVVRKPIIPAGTIAYAQILTEANSDVPGPVLAEIASGPLAGGRALGTFQRAEEHLTLQFNMIIKDGVEYAAQGVALDPGTTLPGVASDVNNHYITRVMLPAAASFISGFAEAATQKDTTTVVSNGTVVTDSTTDLDTGEELLKGVNEGAQKVSEIIDDNAERPITVRVYAGTRIGILFVSSVKDPRALAEQQAEQAGQYGAMAGSFGTSALYKTPAGRVTKAALDYNAYRASQPKNARE